jgi:hypothetical protein
MELITDDKVLIKVDTKHCLNCDHGYQDHFTDSLKYPKPRRCGCGIQLCCYGGCECGEYIPKIIDVPYSKTEQQQDYGPHEYIRFDHCDECKAIDYKDREQRASKHPNYSLGEEFIHRYDDLQNKIYPAPTEDLPYKRIKEHSNSTQIDTSVIPGIPFESWRGRVKEASKLIIQNS